MKKKMRMTLMTIAFVGWVGLFSGSANADTIYRIDPNNHNIPILTPPTITILATNWLPEPEQTITVQVNGVTVQGFTLESSHYTGVCTNFGTGTGDDFTLGTVIGNQFSLTSHDCGGSATLTVTDTANNQFVFKIPQDSNNNDIPDVWETLYGGNLDATSDQENPPDPNNSTKPNPPDPNCLESCREGDGISAFDEYRGFIVSSADKTSGYDTSVLQANTKHIRTNPLVKDLFVHVVNNECATAPPPMGTFSHYFRAGVDMFAGLSTLVDGVQIHFLDYTPGVFPNPKTSSLWEDYFDHFAIPNTVWFKTAANVLTNMETDVPTDRQINKNAMKPVMNQTTNSTIQKGVRLIECQATNKDVLGWANWGTPNKSLSSTANYAGNSIVFPERVRQDVQTKLADAGLRQIWWAKFNPKTALWETQSPALAANQNQDTQDFLATNQIQYLVGMELGHLTQLRPSILNGYHSATGHGSEMDATIQVTKDSKNTATKKYTFYIPSQFLLEDQIETRFKN